MTSKPHGIPEGLSNRTSPPILLTPAVKHGDSHTVGIRRELYSKDIVESLDTETSPGAPHIPSMGELLQKIAEVRRKVVGIKLAQDNKLKEVKEEVKNGLKNQIAETLKDEISGLVAGSVATRVERGMAEWGEQSEAASLLSGLQGTLTTNNLTLEEAQIQLENSCSRHENSAIDIQADFCTALKPIKRKDGLASKLFPPSLRALFSYDATQLVRLLEEHDLHPFTNHGENLNRFLIFIGHRPLVQE